MQVKNRAERPCRGEPCRGRTHLLPPQSWAQKLCFAKATGAEGTCWVRLLGWPGASTADICCKQSGGCKSEIQVTAGLAPPEALLLGTWMVVSSCVLVPLSLWVYLCPLLFLQGRWSSWIRPTLAIAFYLNHLCKGPIPNQSHSDLLGFRTPADEFREWDTVQSTAPGVLGHRAIMGNPSGGESRPPTS